MLFLVLKVAQFAVADGLCNSLYVIFSFGATVPHQWARGLLIHEISRSHTTTHHSRPGRVISPSQRPLPDNTQHSQQTDIHAPGGIRTHNLSRRAAADLRLRPRGHWDRLVRYLDLDYSFSAIPFSHLIHHSYKILNSCDD